MVTGEKADQKWPEGDDIAAALQLPGLRLHLKWVEQVIETSIWFKQTATVHSVSPHAWVISTINLTTAELSQPQFGF